MKQALSSANLPRFLGKALPEATGRHPGMMFSSLLVVSILLLGLGQASGVVIESPQGADTEGGGDCNGQNDTDGRDGSDLVAGPASMENQETMSASQWSSVTLAVGSEAPVSLTIGGRIQPRFEYRRPDGAENTTRFRFRRVRLDFRGKVIGDSLTFRVMPELRDGSQLDTAFVNYGFSKAMQVRAGQFDVPFAWERDVSSSRHQLTERSIANNEFQWPGGGGKDVGVALHGVPRESIRYEVGVFGGEGRNLSGESTEGVMLSGRGTWSALGSYPKAEALVHPVERAALAFGMGGWFTNQNRVKDWYPWDEESKQSAHAYATTVDAHWQFERVSTHLSGFLRRVQPREAGFAAYDGYGWNAQAGYLILQESLFGSLRYAESLPDSDRDKNRMREWVAGLQVFHNGHQSKLHLETGLEEEHDGEGWNDTGFVRVQYQFLF